MKFTLVNWSYNEIGHSLSITSTDYETARQVSELCMNHVKAYKRVRNSRFSKDGGTVTIEGIETVPERSDLNRFLTEFFVREGWKADKRANHSFSKTEHI